MDLPEVTEEKRITWLDIPLLNYLVLNAETILWILILVLSVFSRFYMLGARVMSHDENTHVYYSWRFFKGFGFQHDPLMHGPLLFHLIAATYFMFGDSDFTARLSAALAGIAMIMFMWFYRRYLGKAGALIAAFLLLISPYILYYDRYARNEAYVALFGVVTIWSLLCYLDTGQARYLYLLTTATVLHFTSKETSFIYTAQLLIFLAGYLVYRVTSMHWPDRGRRKEMFTIFLMLGLIMVAAMGAVVMMNRSSVSSVATLTPTPNAATQELGKLPSSGLPGMAFFFLGLGGLAFLASLYFLIRGYSWEALRKERAFGMLIVLTTLVMPQLAAFPVRFVGWKIPTNASEVMALTSADILHIAAFVIPLLILSIVIGMLWNPREWLINAAIFWGIFTVFYTSVFTNGAGFFTGLVGSLGYWLEQQGVNRGSQPWYFYAFIQVPVYEYLPALGTWLAFGIAIFDWLKSPRRIKVEQVEPLEGEFGLEPALEGGIPGGEQEDLRPVLVPEKGPVFPLLGFWAITSMIAFTVAGEKMPWLTVHITLPAILCTAWALNRIVDSVDWKAFRERRGWLVLVVLAIFMISFAATLSSLLGAHPPFQGKQLDSLQATSTFLTSFLVACISGGGLYFLLKPWPLAQFSGLAVLAFFGFLSLMTIHTSVQANYINYDYANELLVYAHSAPGDKIALAQIEEISKRTTDGLSIGIAYDNSTSYPFWWYLRNYPNAHFYGADPSRTLRDDPLILVGDENYAKIEPVVGDLYNRFDYVRLWWPNQDYFDLNWDRIKFALTDPAMREALFQIWLNRDYTQYGKVTNKDMSYPNWTPGARMRLYVRKDVISKLWNYGVAPSVETVKPDPFQGKQVDLTADKIIGSPGQGPGQFAHPHDLAVAQDGSLYVVDTDNSRIQHLSPDGTVLQTWGTFADITNSPAPGGTFNQPWGIALAPDESVYVADTWNHRIQKFTADGQFVSMWGVFGQTEAPTNFWGPRDIAVDASGRVFVTDTGNKRVTVFDDKGTYVTQFGGAGMGAGQLDEPVGIAVDQGGVVYVADTWNQRIQTFSQGSDGTYAPLTSWDLQAWYGQSLDNKPYLTVDDKGFVYATDPEGFRVLQFNAKGDAVRSWGDFGTGENQFGLAAAVAWDNAGGVWVSDSANNRLMHFTLPAP